MYIHKNVEKFFSSYPLKHYKKGESIILSGSAPEGISYIISGRVRQYDISDNGTKIIVNSYRTGAYFPMAWALNDSLNNYFYEAIIDTNVRIASKHDVLTFIRSNPDVALDLLERVFSGAEGLYKKLAFSMQNNAYRQVILELVIECDRSKKQNSNINLVPLSEVELATHIGLARETVNRQISKLKSEELVSITTAGIVIKDLESLRDKL